MTARFVRSGAVTVVTLTGELDLSSADALELELQLHHQPGVRMIVDLTHVDFMDCAGARVLVNARDAFGPDQFAVTPGPPQVQMLFRLANIEGLVEVVSDSVPR